MPGIAVLVAGVSALAQAVREARPLVEDIRSGMRAKNDDTKSALSRRLADVEASLSQVGELARAASDYGQSLEDVLDLLWLCERARRVLRENYDDFNDPTHPGYRAKWELFESLWEMIDNHADVIRKAAMGLDEWYDDADNRTMQVLLSRFASARSSASAFFATRAAGELVRELDEMIRQLKDADTLLRNTLYERILRTLQTVR